MTLLNKKIFAILLYCLFLLCLVPVAVFSYKHPANNWDMLGYMAIVIRMDGIKDNAEVHRITYKTAKENIPAPDYKQLVDSSGPRGKLAGDPFLFGKILPIHVVKPLYTWFVYIFYKAGLNLPAATVAPSLAAYFLTGLLLFHWMKKYLRPLFAFFTSLLLMTSIFIIATAKLSTPDMLSAFFLATAFYFILERPDMRWLFLFLLLSVFTRVDNIITSFFIISFLFVTDKWSIKITKKQYALMLFFLASAYLIIVLPVRQLGWNVFYYSEYSKHMNFNRDFDKSLSLTDYFSYMSSKIVTGLVSSQFTFFMFLAALILFQPLPIKLRSFSFDQLLVLMLLIIIATRFLLLPDFSDRFYLAFYLVILFALIRKIKNFTTDTPKME